MFSSQNKKTMYTHANITFSYIMWGFPGCSFYGLVNVMGDTLKCTNLLPVETSFQKGLCVQANRQDITKSMSPAKKKINLYWFPSRYKTFKNLLRDQGNIWNIEWGAARKKTWLVTFNDNEGSDRSACHAFYSETLLSTYGSWGSGWSGHRISQSGLLSTWVVLEKPETELKHKGISCIWYKILILEVY